MTDRNERRPRSADKTVRDIRRATRRKFVSNSANTPSMSKNALPAAVEVLMGCSVALSATPFAFNSWTVFCKPCIERASRSTRVMTMVSPLFTNLELSLAGPICSKSKIAPRTVLTFRR